MKKVLSVFMLMCIVSGFAGCSSDDAVPENIIVPNSVDKSVKDFFETELPIYSPLQHTEEVRNAFAWNGDPYSESFTLINSMEEFQALYRGQKQLPQIDFSSQTLVVGWLRSDPVSGVELEIDKNTNELNVYMIRLKSNVYAVVVKSIAYWGVFPKLKTEPRQVNTILVWR